MKYRNILLLFVIVIFANGSSFAQVDSIVNKIISIGQSDNQTMQHLDVLCNVIGGRITGSDACENAENWAASKFREWGMEVMIDEVGSVPVGFNRGPYFGRIVGGEELRFATPSYTSGTKGPQRGHVVIEPKTWREFNRMKGKLKGAWVLVSGKNEGWPIDFSEKSDSLRKAVVTENEITEKKNDSIRRLNWENRKTGKEIELLPMKEEPALFYKEMVEAGILGIIQSAPVPINAMYDRKNIDKMSFDKLPKVPDIKLDEKQYKIIEQMAKERQYFELEFDIRNHFKPGPVKYHNVIGIIPGTDFPDEYVIMGGHLDSYDIASGCNDNGSGVAPAMEAARLIMASGGRPKRTILVCLWAAEEFGLLGSTSWVDRNPEKLDKISNMFNKDGGTTVTTNISVSEAMWSDMEKICKPLLDTINPDFPFKMIKREPRPKPEKASGTDSGPFAVKGIPTMQLGTEDVKGYDFNYGEIWHTERDQFNLIIPEYLEHTSIVTAVAVYGIANLDHLLSRDGYFLPPKIEEKKSEDQKKNKK